MSDHHPHDSQSGAEPASAHSVGTAPAVLVSRRRFAKVGAAAAPVVLGSLVSKPVLAAIPYQCTVSGKLSGNTSSHPGTVDCKALGKSPATWKTTTTWPPGVVRGTAPSGTCSFSGGTKGTAFNALTFGGFACADVFRYKTLSPSCVVYDMSEGANYSSCSSSNKATLLQILSTGSSGDNATKALGRAAVASLLNALNNAGNYPLTPAQVIKMFNAVYRGGKYQVNATISWDAAQVKAYFETLYT